MPAQTGMLTVSMSLTENSNGSSLASRVSLVLGKTAIHQPRHAGNDQRDCQGLDGVHGVSSGRKTTGYRHRRCGGGVTCKTRLERSRAVLGTASLHHINRGSLHASTAYDAYQDHDDRDHQENMNQSTHGV